MGLPLLKMIVESHSVTKGNDLVTKFLSFLEDEKVTQMKKDEWETVYFFFKKHRTLDDYTEMDAWPVIFDKFANNYK